jgi:hypothetical protein
MSNIEIPTIIIATQPLLMLACNKLSRPTLLKMTRTHKEVKENQKKNKRKANNPQGNPNHHYGITSRAGN